MSGGMFSTALNAIGPLASAGMGIAGAVQSQKDAKRHVREILQSLKEEEAELRGSYHEQRGRNLADLAKRGIRPRGSPLSIAQRNSALVDDDIRRLRRMRFQETRRVYEEGERAMTGALVNATSQGLTILSTEMRETTRREDLASFKDRLDITNTAMKSLYEAKKEQRKPAPTSLFEPLGPAVPGTPGWDEYWQLWNPTDTSGI